MLFHTEGLLCKWGFDDGDILDDLLRDAGLQPDPKIGDKFFPHRVLEEVIVRFVLPVAQPPVTVTFIGCIHNPVRAKTVGGEDAEPFWYGSRPSGAPVLSPASVEVPDDVILAIACEIYTKEYAA